MNVTTQQVGANKPILLDNYEDIWLVKEGSVDVFAVKIDQDGNQGRRYHLFRVPTNGAFFGCQFAEAPAVKLLAVALNDTVVKRFSASLLFPQFSINTQEKSKLALDHLYLFDDWVRKLIAAITLSPKSTYQFEMLQSGENTVKANSTIYVESESKYWLKLKSGSLTINDYTKTTITEQTGYFPAFNPITFETNNPASFEAFTSVEWITQKFSFIDLNYFYQIIGNNLQQKIINIEEQVLSSIETQKIIDKNITKKPLNQFAALLNPEYGAEQASYTTANPIVRALEIITKTQGFEIDSKNILQFLSTRKSTEQTIQSQITEIADRLSVRLRQVKLTKNWWQSDCGYMIGIGKNNAIYVLAPVKNTSYDAIDMQTDERIKISAKSINNFLNDAFVVYKSSKEKTLTWKNYIKQGLFQTENTIKQILILGIISGILGAATPIVNGLIFNQVIPNSDMRLYYQVIAVLLASLIASNVFNLIKGFTTLRFKIKVGSVLQSIVWDRILRLPTSFFKQFSVGNLAFRANQISQRFEDILQSLVEAVINVAILIINLILLSYYEPILALPAIAFSFLLIGLYLIFNWKKIHYGDVIYAASAKADGLSRQLFSNIIKIRNNAIEHRAFNQWAELFLQETKYTMKSNRVDIFSNVLQNVIVAAINMVFFGIIIVFSPRSMPGNLIAFFSAYALWNVTLFSIANLYYRIMMLNRIFNKYMRVVFETEPEDSEIKNWPTAITGDIVIDKLSFKYDEDGPLILNDISLQIHPYEFAAIVGPSGCGKSTLLRLMLGFETPLSGEIIYDGMNISDVDIKILRKNFGVVLQNSALATASIYENITSGNTAISLEEAWEASKFAGLDEFINSLPMKMHTLVMEGGGAFSGGQRQQIMIARAIARKTPIMFFDEASSALDNRTQDIVSKNLKNLRATRIVVAHRLSTILNADQIYVMEAGRLVQRGNYAQLMHDERGLFAKLAQRQLL